MRNIWILYNGPQELYRSKDDNEKRFWFGGCSVILCAYKTYREAYKEKKLAQKDKWNEPAKIWIKRVKINI